jgi:hypothetical protein
MMGIEVFGVAWSGQTQTIVEDRPMRPTVAWGQVMPAPPAVHVGLPEHRQPARGAGHHHKPAKGAGLRIRLED